MSYTFPFCCWSVVKLLSHIPAILLSSASSGSVSLMVWGSKTRTQQPYSDSSWGYRRSVLFQDILHMFTRRLSVLVAFPDKVRVNTTWWFPMMSTCTRSFWWPRATAFTFFLIVVTEKECLLQLAVQYCIQNSENTLLAVKFQLYLVYVGYIAHFTHLYHYSIVISFACEK